MVTVEGNAVFTADEKVMRERAESACAEGPAGCSAYRLWIMPIQVERKVHAVKRETIVERFNIQSRFEVDGSIGPRAAADLRQGDH